jgi:hypothetical protein
VILGEFMGWSGGSELMSEIISAVQALKSTDDAQIQELYRRMIVEFENNHDCDTLEECLGEDQRFDFALMYVRGFECGMRGDSVEYAPLDYDQDYVDKWQKGYSDGVEFERNKPDDDDECDEGG